jgi:hypothetical protein
MDMSYGLANFALFWGAMLFGSRYGLDVAAKQFVQVVNFYNRMTAIWKWPKQLFPPSPESASKILLISTTPVGCLALAISYFRQVAVGELVFDARFPEIVLCLAAAEFVMLTIVTRLSLSSNYYQAGLVSLCFVPIGLVVCFATYMVSFFFFLMAHTLVSGFMTLFWGGEPRFP